MDSVLSGEKIAARNLRYYRSENPPSESRKLAYLKKGDLEIHKVHNELPPLKKGD